MNTGAFIADDVSHLVPGQLKSPLEEAALLVPLYAESEQLGVLILGRPANGLRYADEDVESLLNSTDRLGEIILIARRKAENLAQIAQLAEAQHELSNANPIPIAVKTVEDALRNLYDYAFLADTCLATLHLVDSRLSHSQVTHLERGKVVHELLLEAIDKLCPGSNHPHNPPPREWYPYLILHEAYIEEVSNRDIMQKLYISEGTFNRTRRSAIRSLARALGEMEAALSWVKSVHSKTGHQVGPFYYMNTDEGYFVVDNLSFPHCSRLTILEIGVFGSSSTCFGSLNIEE
jgi:hypothetical protein